MNRAQLSEHVKTIIMLHYGWDMWASRSQFSFDDGVQPFIDAITELTEHASRGEKLKKLDYVEDDIRSDLNCVIGNRLRELRREKGISVDQMAERMDINADYYSDIERGAAWMRTNDLRDAVHILEVPSSAVLPF